MLGCSFRRPFRFGPGSGCGRIDDLAAGEEVVAGRGGDEVDLDFGGEPVMAGGHEAEGGVVSGGVGPGSSSAGVGEAVLVGGGVVTVGEGRFGGERTVCFGDGDGRKLTSIGASGRRVIYDQEIGNHRLTIPQVLKLRDDWQRCEKAANLPNKVIHELETSASLRENEACQSQA